jgi:excisionase family DNA binding protein
MVQVITGDTPIYQLSVNQLLGLLSSGNNQTPQPIAEAKQPEYVYGLSGLAALLNCSLPTAQRIKDSGKIPYSQVGRKLVFNADEVLKAIGKNQNKRKIRA